MSFQYQKLTNIEDIIYINVQKNTGMLYYYDEDMNLHCDQVNWFHAMYYKGRKYKRRNVTCPNCRTTYLRLVRKEKDLLKLECPDCFETYKDLYEEFLENS